MKFKEFLLEKQDIYVAIADIKNGRLIKKYNNVDGDFNCIHNKLTSLEGGPSFVGGHFECNNNELISLEGGPSSVGRSFLCHDNLLTNLEGGPISVGGFFDCAYNQITSLEGIGKRYLRQMNGKLYLNDNPIKSNVLGVLLIKGCKGIEMDNIKEVEEILNRHLKSDKDIMECREELIAAGFKEYAKL